MAGAVAAILVLLDWGCADENTTTVVAWTHKAA
jgi:hypothetical protein